MKKLVTMFVMMMTILVVSCSNDSTGGGDDGKTIDLSSVLKNHTFSPEITLSTGSTGVTGELKSVTWNAGTKTFTSQADAITAVNAYDGSEMVYIILSMMEMIAVGLEDTFSAYPIVTEKVAPVAGGVDGEWSIRLTADDGFKFDNGTKFYDYKLVIQTK